MVAEAQKKGNERNLKVHRDAKKKCIAMYPCIAENHRRVALQTHRDAQYQVEDSGSPPRTQRCRISVLILRVNGP